MASIRPSARGLDETVLAAAQAAKSAAFDRGYPPREQARRNSHRVMLGKIMFVLVVLLILDGYMYIYVLVYMRFGLI